MSKAITHSDRIGQALEDGTLEAIEALRDTLKRGGFQDKVAASKALLDRTIPIPKPGNVQIVASTGAAARDITMAIVHKRIAQQTTDTTDTVDATFTPLVRVQSSE